MRSLSAVGLFCSVVCSTFVQLSLVLTFSMAEQRTGSETVAFHPAECQQWRLTGEREQLAGRRLQFASNCTSRLELPAPHRSGSSPALCRHADHNAAALAGSAPVVDAHYCCEERLLLAAAARAARLSDRDRTRGGLQRLLRPTAAGALSSWPFFVLCCLLLKCDFSASFSFCAPRLIDLRLKQK